MDRYARRVIPVPAGAQLIIAALLAAGISIWVRTDQTVTIRVLTALCCWIAFVAGWLGGAIAFAAAYEPFRRTTSLAPGRLRVPNPAGLKQRGGPPQRGNMVGHRCGLRRPWARTGQQARLGQIRRDARIDAGVQGAHQPDLPRKHFPLRSRLFARAFGAIDAPQSPTWPLLAATGPDLPGPSGQPGQGPATAMGCPSTAVRAAGGLGEGRECWLLLRLASCLRCISRARSLCQGPV